MGQELSIFNIGEHQEEMNQAMFAPRTESNLFDPKLKNVQDTIVFIARPMPYINDVVNSICTKKFYALRDAGGTVIFDSMTTFNRPQDNFYQFCPVSDLWLKLHNAQDPNVKKLEGYLRLQTANYAYMQIINYPGDPSLNGKMVVMRLPAEAMKTFNSMANPSDADIALGVKPTQPMDLFNGKNIKFTITGKMVDNQVMRDWKVEVQEPAGNAQFPLGPNGQFLPISQLSQEAVVAYFKEQQSVDLKTVYGYHEPNVDVKRRVKAILFNLVQYIPGLPEVVNSYMPELNAQLATDQNMQPGIGQPVQQSQTPHIQQPAAQPIPPQQPEMPTGQPAPGFGPTQPAQPQQPAQPAQSQQQPQQPAQPQQPMMPGQQPIVAGDPMNTNVGGASTFVPPVLP